MTDEQRPDTAPEDAARIAALEAENARPPAALSCLSSPPARPPEQARMEDATSAEDQAGANDPFLVGRPHRTRRDVEMLVLDYDRGVATVTLPAGSVFQPWRTEDHWRGVKIPITLGDGAPEFDWGVTSADGHFLRWEDFFDRCALVDQGATSPNDPRSEASSP